MSNEILPSGEEHIQTKEADHHFERYQCEITGEIKTRLVATRKKVFDWEMKKAYAEAYSRHGRVADAARSIGVVASTIWNHLRQDDAFAALVADAAEEYKSRLLAHHQDLLFNGTKTYKYDKEGNVVEEKTEYPIRLIELELKKHDDGYRDKREVKHDVTGGVLLMPQTSDSIDDWEKNHGSKIIDQNAEDAEILDDD